MDRAINIQPRLIRLQDERYDAYLFEFISREDRWSCAAFINRSKSLNEKSLWPSRCALASYRHAHDFCLNGVTRDIYNRNIEVFRTAHFGGSLPLSRWENDRTFVPCVTSSPMQRVIEDAVSAFHFYVGLPCIIPLETEDPNDDVAAISQSLASAQRKLASLDKELASIRAERNAIKQENGSLLGERLKLERQVESLRRSIVVGDASLKTEIANLKQENLLLKAKCFDIISGAKPFSKGA